MPCELEKLEHIERRLRPRTEQLRGTPVLIFLRLALPITMTRVSHQVGVRRRLVSRGMTLLVTLDVRAGVSLDRWASRHVVWIPVELPERLEAVLGDELTLDGMGRIHAHNGDR